MQKSGKNLQHLKLILRGYFEIFFLKNIIGKLQIWVFSQGKYFFAKNQRMPITKNAFIRYQALDRCFSNTARKFYVVDLLEYCNNALADYDSNSSGIRKRQLFDDIKFMESSQGWNIPLERVKDGKKVYYRYSDTKFSINNEPINVLEAEQIKAALLVFKRVKGLPQFKWMHALVLKLEKDFQLQTTERECISFDTNEYLKGIEHIGTLFNAILYKRVLSIVYQSFNSTQSTTIVLSPYYLKQFNNRWFLFGKSNDYDTMTNLALDRIVSIEELDLPYQTSTLDFDEYFEDVLGVTVPEEAKLTKIIFRVAESLAPYIQTKPIHGSQKQLSKNSKEFLFSIEVLPNYELEKHLLAFGEDLIVIEPHDFRNKIRDRLLKSIKKYKSISCEK